MSGHMRSLQPKNQKESPREREKGQDRATRSNRVRSAGTIPSQVDRLSVDMTKRRPGLIVSSDQRGKRETAKRVRTEKECFLWQNIGTKGKRWRCLLRPLLSSPEMIAPGKTGELQRSEPMKNNKINFHDAGGSPALFSAGARCVWC